MKTLDEVIKAWSICFSDNSRSDCTGCPYADEDGDAACFNHDRVDALNYLREYQKDKQIYSYDIARRNLEVAERNDPLSWDELKGMEGKPVWVEEPAFFGSRWVIISGFNEEAVFGTSVGSQVFFCRDCQGVEWQAYREERK